MSPRRADSRSPTTPDLLLFAHLSLLLTPTFPNPLLPDLIRSTYPSLSAHHDRVRSALFGGARIHADSSSDASAGAYAVIHRITLPPSPTLWESLSDTVSSWWADTTTGNGSGSASAGDKPRKKTAKEKEFERGRWAWFAAAGVGMVVYLLASGLVRVEYAGEGDDEEEGEENEDGDEDEDEEEDEDEDEDLGPLTGLVEEEDDE
jgi:sorting and assembly machinery component 37